MPTGKLKELYKGGTREQRIDQISAPLWILLGVVILIQLRGVEYMSEYGPGPGFLPVCIGAGMILSGLLMAISNFRRRSTEETVSFPNRQIAFQMILVMIAFFTFAFLCEQIGFLFGIGLLFFFLLVVVERKKWLFSLMVSIVFTLAFWVIFEFALTLRLPTGFWGSLL